MPEEVNGENKIADAEKNISQAETVPTEVSVEQKPVAKSNSSALVVVIIILVVAILGIFVWFYLKSRATSRALEDAKTQIDEIMSSQGNLGANGGALEEPITSVALVSEESETVPGSTAGQNSVSENDGESTDANADESEDDPLLDEESNSSASNNSGNNSSSQQAAEDEEEEIAEEEEAQLDDYDFESTIDELESMFHALNADSYNPNQVDVANFGL